MSAGPVILWFRNDLRLSDHPALAAAVRARAPIIPLYILDDISPGPWAMGSASRWWLGQSLKALASELAARGSRLILRRGDARVELLRMAEECKADAIYFTRSYEPWAVSLEHTLGSKLAAKGIGFRRFGGRLLREPEEVLNKNGEPYRVYTPFWRAAFAGFVPAKAVAPPRRLSPVGAIASDRLEDWQLSPVGPDWSSGLSKAWHPGESGAKARLSEFVSEKLQTYGEYRDRPDKAGTSRLSPHLAFGEISAVACWRAASEAAEKTRGADHAVERFLQELVWREFSYHLLYHWPSLPSQPWRKEFDVFAWREDVAQLEAWKRGKTGYPIVDAGQRELWATGYMHNRVRMITASFLVKHLLIPWWIGEAWFWDTLVDADLANNAASWQWVAGCGADAAPYFRIFNPVLQGKTFDPQGTYVRRWVPELARLPTPLIHEPWLADTATRETAGVKLGETYPRPVVSHEAARRRALEAYERLKGAATPRR